MSVQEQMKFWQEEYSKPAPARGNKAKWNERKYGYSIRHMYGLEGSRVSQEAWTCAQIQLSTSVEPSCPFVLPAAAAARTLPAALSAQPDCAAQVIALVEQRRPCAACAACLGALKRCPTGTHIAAPSDFVLKYNNLMDW